MNTLVKIPQIERERIAALMRGQPTSSLAQIWQNNNVLAIRQPQSNVERIQERIVALYSGFDIDIQPCGINYFDEDVGFFFDTASDMFSNAGSHANQIVRQSLADDLQKKVTVGGDRNVVKVWVKK